jgi:hypothetical protein
MCGSKPSIPKPPPPPQEIKQPDTANLKDKGRKNRENAAMGGGSLLTGPGGIASVSTGKSSLLGG